MINGIHALIFTSQPEGVRAFFRDVLGLPSVDSGGGWLIFGLPPAELGIHPAEGERHNELYLMCEDIEATLAELRSKGLVVSEPAQEQYGRVAQIKLPDGSELPLYQPAHPTALGLKAG